jgi:hypothetical protein
MRLRGVADGAHRQRDIKQPLLAGPRGPLGGRGATHGADIGGLGIPPPLDRQLAGARAHDQMEGVSCFQSAQMHKQAAWGIVARPGQAAAPLLQVSRAAVGLPGKLQQPGKPFRGGR